METKDVPMMINVAAVRRRFKDHEDVNVSGDIATGLNEKVDQLMKEAVRRCIDNGRKTVRAVDL